MTTNLNPVHTGPGRQLNPVTGAPGKAVVISTTAPGSSGLLVQVINEGGGGDDMYFEQDFTNSSQWHASHNFNKVPNVAVFDSTGHETIADVNADANTVTVTWPGPTSGKVVCS